jgi:hypothetical protein
MLDGGKTIGTRMNDMSRVLELNCQRMSASEHSHGMADLTSPLAEPVSHPLVIGAISQKSYHRIQWSCAKKS